MGCCGADVQTKALSLGAVMGKAVWDGMQWGDLCVLVAPELVSAQRHFGVMNIERLS